MSAKVEMRRAPYETHRVAPGQFVERWCYSYRIDGGEWTLWDRGAKWVRDQAARRAGIKPSEVIDLWKVVSE